MTYRVLVVEADPHAIKFITSSMASMGHECHVVSNQQDAFRLLKATQFTYLLVASQIQALPDDGSLRLQNTENLLEQIAALDDRPVPPTVIMVDQEALGPAEMVDLMRSAMAMGRCGAVDVVVKPFPKTGRTLDRVVKEALRPGAPAAVGRGGGGLSTMVPAAIATAAAPSKEAMADWLTATAAAELLMKDIPGLDLAKARSRVSTAAGNGEFKSFGSRRNRRIEPTSFNSWRLGQRDRDLDRADDDEAA